MLRPVLSGLISHAKLVFGNEIKRATLFELFKVHYGNHLPVVGNIALIFIDVIKLERFNIIASFCDRIFSGRISVDRCPSVVAVNHC